ncbi:MAG: hypothetical protein IPJ01_10435 [Micavibrio sp.]|nr:hypothetical protein [Micavibrio sp.]
MEKEVEIINTKKLPEVKQENAISLPDGMINDAFTALCLSILGEFFMSGDTKYLIFQGMLSNLKEKGYSEEDMNKFKDATKRIFDTYHKPNGFMG